MFKDLWHRMRALFWRGKVEGELDDELGFHLERQVEKLYAEWIEPRRRLGSLSIRDRQAWDTSGEQLEEIAW